MNSNSTSSVKNKESQSRAAIYCRVSTYDQAQGTFSSLDAQVSSLTDYCNAKGWSIYKVYRDTKSGKSLNREKIQELLSDAEDQKFDVILSTKLDRLSRNMRDFFELDDRLRKLDVDMVITTQNIDTTTPGGRAMRNMLLVFAEFEREMIGQRTREKLYNQAQKGYWGGGFTPLGYDSVDKKLIVNEEEAKIVRRIYNMYTDGNSVMKIADILNREGFKPKERKIKGKIKYSTYNKNSILRILKSKIYLGLISLKVSKLNGKVLQLPIVEEFKGLHAPIIDPALYKTVNDSLAIAKTNKFQDYNQSELILLQRMICGFCGSAMTTTFATKPDGRRIYGYKCSSKSKKGAGACECKDAPAKAVEVFLSSLLTEIGSTKETVSLIFDQMQTNNDSEVVSKKTHIADLKRNLAKLENEAKGLLRTMAQYEDIGLTETAKALFSETQEKVAAIKAEISQAEDEVRVISERTESRETVEDLLTKVPELLKTLGKKDQRSLVQFLINEIRWKVKKGEKEGEIEIFFRGDGRINKKWANKVDPLSLASSFCLGWLREQDSNLQPFG